MKIICQRIQIQKVKKWVLQEEELGFHQQEIGSRRDLFAGGRWFSTKRNHAGKIYLWRGKERGLSWALELRGISFILQITRTTQQQPWILDTDKDIQFAHCQQKVIGGPFGTMFVILYFYSLGQAMMPPLCSVPNLSVLPPPSEQERGRKNPSMNDPLACICQMGLKIAEQSKFKVFSYLFDHSRSLLIGGGSNKRRIQINSLQLLSRPEGPSVGDGVPV